MKRTKRLLGVLLSAAMLLSLLPMSFSFAAESYQPQAKESDYFYRQLNARAQAIYTKLLSEFTKNAETYYEGKAVIDLMNLTDADGNTVISEQDVTAYAQQGNKDIFNDFCAAKDALDLDHSELWYLDSGYLTFSVTKDTSGYHVLIGPGRGETYLLAGQPIDDLKTKITETEKAIQDITDKALADLKTAEAQADAEYSDQDRISYLVTSVHDQVTKSIHYRYEIECREINGVEHANAKYIRTLYGVVTHEGVCESYARTLQVALTKLGVECVLIHGVHTKGTPEDHMWNAVNIPEGDTDHWYMVDATMDDPLIANYDGSRDLTYNEGLDSRETNTYLLVGQSVANQYWNPSGYVSTGNFEFTYPVLETSSYAGATVYEGSDGLKVKYSAGGSQEDGVPAGVYTVTFNGMNDKKAREQGFYFMIKQYDFHPDGTASVMEDWYYAYATILVTGGDNPYFGDFEDGLRFSSATCEYSEIAVTTRAPDHVDEWTPDASTSYLSRNWEAGFYHGTEAEIVATSGMLYNINSTYEAPPYVTQQDPAPNGNATAGYEYRFRVLYDDDLYHILPSDKNAGIAKADNFVNDYETAKTQDVQVRYYTNQEDLHNPGQVMATQVVGELPFDVNRDGIVDTSEYTDFRWIYKSDPQDLSGQGVKCPNTDYHDAGHEECSVENGCPIIGVEFNFRASDQWIDDVTMYSFSIEGVVGSRSSKYANSFSVIAMVPGLCPSCYRGQGIDWNVWGQPTLLDAPENLDLHAMAEAGGTDPETLAELDKEMNKSDVNGRLMLVVENKSKGAGNREEYEKIDGYLEDSHEVDGEILSSSVFEINFNRLCPAVKLEPNKGQKIRVQVGYPAGITYERLGSGEIELKAYHFTRCAENEPCEEYQKETAAEKRLHKWGSHIISVEEITIIPTPYGMIIMCDSFSPFEIVAVKPEGTAAAAASETAVVVVSDANGTVSYGDNIEAVGEAGNVTFAEGETKTFTVHPKDGYVVNTVSLDGNEISVGSDGTFTVTAPEKNGVLSVTFAPREIKQTQEEEYGQTVVAAVCTHTHVQDNPDDAPAKEATCTEKGYEPGTVCEDCGQTLTEGKEIPAKGHHVDKNKEGYYTAGKAATCTEPGTRDFVKCADCDVILSNGETVPALGHFFKNYTDEGEPTCQGQKRAAVCERPGCQVKDEQISPSGAVEHEFSAEPHEIRPATCTKPQEKLYKCKNCDETKVVVEGEPLGHDFDKDTHICKNCDLFECADGHKIVETGKLDPTCTEDGHTSGEICSVCGYVQKAEEKIPALGHEFDTETGECKRCGKVGCDEGHHKPDQMKEIPATCTEAGRTGGVKCLVCEDILEQPQPVPAKGHSWDKDSAQWHWSLEEEPVQASVELTCSECQHKESFVAEVSEQVITKPATCQEEGTGTFTATFTAENLNISDTEEITLPKTEHTFGKEPISSTETTCSKHGEKVYQCTVCGLTHTEVDTGELAEHSFMPDSEKSVLATCTEAGLLVSKCHVCGAEKSEPVDALGHTLTKVEGKRPTVTEEGHIEYWVCESCGKLFRDAEGSEEITLEDTVIPAGGYYPSGVAGDLDADGSVDVADSLRLWKFINGRCDLYTFEQDVADFRKDGLDLQDALTVYLLASGIDVTG